MPPRLPLSNFTKLLHPFSTKMSTPIPSLYNNKTFHPTSNSPTGEVDSSTRFHYHQEGRIVWAEYAGGEIERGSLIATVAEDGSLDARYQHVNKGGELMTGVCRSVPEVLGDGRVRLRERWRWRCGGGKRGRVWWRR